MSTSFYFYKAAISHSISQNIQTIHFVHFREVRWCWAMVDWRLIVEVGVKTMQAAKSR